MEPLGCSTPPPPATESSFESANRPSNETESPIPIHQPPHPPPINNNGDVSPSPATAGGMNNSNAAAIVSPPPSSQQQQQQPYVRSPLPPRKRKVKFAPKIRVHQIPHLNNLPPDIVDAVWYTARDYEIIKAQYSQTVRLMMRGHVFTMEEEHTHFCTRGLEGRTREGAKRRQQTKAYALIAVLHEQDKQMLERVYIPERISLIYQNMSAQTRNVAFVQGLKDEQMIQHFMLEEQNQQQDDVGSQSSSSSGIGSNNIVNEPTFNGINNNNIAADKHQNQGLCGRNNNELVDDDGDALMEDIPLHQDDDNNSDNKDDCFAASPAPLVFDKVPPPRTTDSPVSNGEQMRQQQQQGFPLTNKSPAQGERKRPAHHRFPGTAA